MRGTGFLRTINKCLMSKCAAFAPRANQFRINLVTACAVYTSSSSSLVEDDLKKSLPGSPTIKDRGIGDQGSNQTSRHNKLVYFYSKTFGQVRLVKVFLSRTQENLYECPKFRLLCNTVEPKTTQGVAIRLDSFVMLGEPTRHSGFTE